MNRAILIGYLGRDPEFRQTKNGTAVATISVATSSYVNKEKQTEWHTVVLWGPHAESAKNLKKGDGAVVIGEIRTRSWQDQKGVDRYTTEVVVGGFDAAIAGWEFPRKGESKAANNGNPDSGIYKRYDLESDLNDKVPF